jgi:hypothetical protein
MFYVGKFDSIFFSSDALMLAFQLSDATSQLKFLSTALSARNKIRSRQTLVFYVSRRDSKLKKSNESLQAMSIKTFKKIESI